MKSPISSTGFGRRILIRPQISKILVLLVAGIHAAALMLLFFIEVDTWVVVSLSALIIYNLFFYSSPAVFNRVSLGLGQGRPMLIETDTQGWQEVELLSSFKCDWLLVMTVRRRTGVKEELTLLYAKDSMASSPFRQLRVYLNQHN